MEYDIKEDYTKCANKTVAEDNIDFLSYLDKVVSEDTKDKMHLFLSKNPEIRDELFHQTKNAMMSTIYSKNQSRDYIEWVIDTLKYMSRFYK